MITETLTYLVGTPANSVESTLLYALASLTCLVVFDSILGLFRAVAHSLENNR
jgi:hypothetical protein